MIARVLTTTTTVRIIAKGAFIVTSLIESTANLYAVEDDRSPKAMQGGFGVKFGRKRKLASR
jgi:hypothetical protein